MTLTTGIIADGVVAALLVVTILYASVLNRRLAALRGDKAQLQALVQSLATASQQAESGIAALKAATDDIGRQLEKKAEQAQSLREDLTYMIDRGGMLADRLEGTIRTRREEPKSEAARPRAAERPMPPDRPLTADRQRPSDRLRSVDAPRGTAGLMAAAVAAAAEEPTAGGGAPSRTERNLLRALAGRR
ncbi:MAG TPA: DUF6468 domain-containing protein [Stellaceae bacterium]|nr:DUF6468 domain-containing protein [Stellaceae bacterium]